ncbi:MAG: ABC transporter substrate-binding protein [Chloroflexota bacterium]|nr:ABC transporter substrate-binding protein [Chloroflexota bacterium]
MRSHAVTRNLFLLIVILAFGGLLAACAVPQTAAPAAPVAEQPVAEEPAVEEPVAEEPVAEEPEAAAEPDKVVWVSPRGTLEVMDDFNLWVAREMGYFDEMGIDLELQPGPLEALAVTKLVAEGQADIGYPSPGVLLASIDAGMPLVQPWEMMLGQTFNFAMAPDSDIETVQDLEGKSISLGSGGWSVIVDPILVEAGVDPSTVTYLNAGNQWAQAAALGEADAALAWRGLEAQWGAQGLDLKYLIGTDFSNHPSNGYSIRAEDLEDPEMRDTWERFFTANAMAFDLARRNPRCAAQIAYNQFPAVQEQMEPQLAFDSMVELADLYFQSYKDGLGYGYNDMDNWQEYIDTVYDLEQIQNQYEAGQVVNNDLIEVANSFDVERIMADAEACELSEEWAAVTTDKVPWSMD